MQANQWKEKYGETKREEGLEKGLCGEYLKYRVWDAGFIFGITVKCAIRGINEKRLQYRNLDNFLKEYCDNCPRSRLLGKSKHMRTWV